MAKPPVPPPSELDEVERAISVLGGHHPEHERTRRETMAAVAQRRQSLEKELTANARRRRRRLIVIAANALALTVAGVVVWQLMARASRIREALAHEEAAFLTDGFQEIASNQLTARRELEADVPGSSCMVALATEGDFVVRSAGSTFTGARSVGWCGCAPGHATIEATGGGDTAVGLALLRLDGSAAGGPLARAWRSSRPAAWGEAGGECAEAMLDAWITDKRWPRPPVTGTELASLAGGSQLAAAGFHLSTTIAEGTPFSVVDAVAGECELALAPGRELSLRMPAGARPVEHARGAMVWCSSSADSPTVWVEGPGAGRAVIVSAPAGRLGGLLGAVETARDAGYVVSSEATWLRVEDQAWDATAILHASSIADITTGPVPVVPGTPEVRVAAVVASPSAGVTWEPSLAAVACDPPLNVGGRFGESVCVPTAPATLWRKGEAPASAARGAPPLWMSVLAQRREPDAAALLPELLALARRLTRVGFEPTTFEGVTELKDGVRVVGRAGEDAVVAVGLVPSAPWVLPYSDGAAWDLGEAPRVIKLQPGAAVTLRPSAPTSAPLDKRRTVVFRHSVRP